MLVKIKVLSKKIEAKVKGKKKTFLRYFAPSKIVVKGEEDKGKQKKSITVKFTEEAEKKLPKDARFFILVVDTEKNQIGVPQVYEIKKTEDEDGNEVTERPTIWIRGFEDIKLIEVKHRPITDYVEFETEEESEEVEIDSDDVDEEE